jgi:trypsin
MRVNLVVVGASALSMTTAAVFLITVENNAARGQARDASANSAKRAPPGRAAANWTQERLLTAKARLTPQVDPGKIRKRAAVTPRAATPGGTGEARNAGAGNQRISGDPASFPLKWAGKLFYAQPDGDYVCSGQFISNRVILTAAHCVRDMDTGEWFDDFDFRLQYDRGNFSGRHGYECAATKQGWVMTDGGGDPWIFDYAMILATGVSRTGYFGHHWGYADNDYTSGPKVGYPGDILNGQVIQGDNGPFFVMDDEPGIIGLRHGNPRNAGGSSGGAWVGRYSKTLAANNNFAISVTSHHRGDDTTISYGPKFDRGFKELLDYTSRGCR